MTTDTYNGWTNRETWATALQLDNNQQTYNDVRAIADRVWGEDDTLGQAGTPFSDDGLHDIMKARVSRVAEELSDYIEFLLELRDSTIEAGNSRNSDLVAMFDDIGSLWRVDWHEIAEHYLEEHIAEYKELMEIDR